MTPDLLQRLLALSRKTGERFVFVDGEQAIVLLPLERYEELVGEASPTFEPEGRAWSFADLAEQPVEQGAPQSFRPTTRDPGPDIAAVLDDLSSEAGLSEEQFYLEPVE